MIPRPTPRSTVAAVLAAVFLMLALPAPASADPAGPTDYRTDVVGVDPDAEGVSVRMIGGDSFIALDVDSGTTVDVIGYRGEPYLRFGADGVVERNERSPSRWLNDDRYGESALPVEADPEADPDWVVVARDGSYAWHDHRTHWMNPARPPGVEPGGTVLEAVVPLTVDGEAVSVHVRSILLGGPSIWPTVAGLVTAAVLCALALKLSGRSALVMAAVVWSGAAVAVGFWAYRSVPAETGPSPLLWALPLIAVVCGLAALFVWMRISARSLVGSALVALAGIELLLWFDLRRPALVRALVPTDAPLWLDRLIIAGSLVVGAVVLVSAVVTVVAELRRGARSSSVVPER